MCVEEEREREKRGEKKRGGERGRERRKGERGREREREVEASAFISAVGFKLERDRSLLFSWEEKGICSW